MLRAYEHSSEERTRKGALDQNSVKEILGSAILMKAPPTQIRAHLRKKGLLVLETRQITQLKTRHKAKIGAKVLSTKDFKDLCEKHSAVPDDEHKPFITFFHAEGNFLLKKVTELCAFFTTRSLLSQVRLRSNMLHLDATYKVIWEGFPCVIPCISDFGNKEHPLGLAVIRTEDEAHFAMVIRALKEAIFMHAQNFNWRPRYLIKDTAPAIKNAFISVFGDTGTYIDCWAHVARNTFDKIIKAKLPITVFQDIQFLQGLSTRQAFHIGLDLFLSHYEKISEKKMMDFLIYFKKEYVRMFPGWYEGFAPGIPSTNNAQERLHNT